MNGAGRRHAERALRATRILDAAAFRRCIAVGGRPDPVAPPLQAPPTLATVLAQSPTLAQPAFSSTHPRHAVAGRIADASR